MPGVGVANPRHGVDMSAAPWNAIGRVQTELGEKCTGFLVAPAVVMTAAHCLWLTRTQHYIAPASVHFLLAYQKGDFSGAARASRILIANHYDPRIQSHTAWADRATLILDHPVSTRFLGPIALPPPGTPVLLGGYQQDGREIIRVDSECRVRGIIIDGAGHRLLSHDCAATRGASGAPLLVHLPDGRWGVAGINIMANMGDKGGLAAPLSP